MNEKFKRMKIPLVISMIRVDSPTDLIIFKIEFRCKDYLKHITNFVSTCLSVREDQHHLEGCQRQR